MKSIQTTTESQSSSTPATTQAPASPPSSETPPAPAQLGHAPSVPGGWTKLDGAEVHRYKHLTGAQGVQANAVAAELSTSATYAKDFGPHAPSQGVVVTALQTTGALVLEQPRALAWEEYVADMRIIQGDTTLSLIDQLGAAADLAKVSNPELAQTYPLLMAFLHTRSEASSRGVETKKANAKSKKQPAAPAPAPAMAKPAGS